MRIGNVCRTVHLPSPVGGRGFPFAGQCLVHRSGSCEFCGRPLDSVTKISERCAMTVVAALLDL